MKRRVALLNFACASLLLTWGGGGPAVADDAALSSDAVEDAIERAALWLKSQRTPAGHWDAADNRADRAFAGDTALALLALLYAGEDPREEQMARGLKWLAGQELSATYTRSLRAHVLALSGSTYRIPLGDDADWLKKAMWPAGSPVTGGYDYGSAEGKDSGGWADNSNAQYAVLGMWMASEAGVDVAPEYWMTVRDYWTRGQNRDGGWGYQHGGNSTGSMTAAGLATLFVVLDRAYASDEGHFNGKSSAYCGQHREAGLLISAINAGLDWFGTNYTPDNPGGELRWKYYYLYGVERTGRASGQRRFRGHDWFREGAANLLAEQSEDGSWTGGGEEMSALRSTCFALMFLCHGRAPLLFNKLEHPGDWNNKLRDVAGLTRYAHGALERFFNWQAVSLDSPLNELLEAPVLYMTGHEAVKFSPAQEQKLREYCEHGGLIFAVACCSRPEFSESVQRLAARLFPDFPIHALPSTHPLFSGDVQYRIEKDAPEMLEVHNGARALLFLSTQDVCAAWSQGLTRRWDAHFQLGVNVYLYATDKTPVRTRLENPELPLESTDIKRTIKIARIRHGGGWDVEPFGWTRLGRYLNNRIGTRLLVTSGVTFDSPALEEIRVAHITGTRGFELSEAEMSGLRRFLTGGGTLLADAANGSPEFLASFEQHVRAALKVEPMIVADDSLLFTAEGVADAVKLSAFGYRRAARRLAGGGGSPRLKAFELGKRLAVIYSPLDISIGLLGTPVYDCKGLDPDTSLRVIRNLLLYANLTSAEKAKASNGGKR